MARAWQRTPAVPSSPAPRTPTPAHTRSPSPIERRRLPRIAVLSALDGYGVDLDLKVTVLEISLGGFSVESPEPFVVGSEHAFLFSAADGRETMVRCQCRHVKMSGGLGKPTYIAGFEFLPQPAENLELIADTVARLQRHRARQV